MDLSDFLLSLVSFEPNELEDIMSCFEKKKINKVLSKKNSVHC